jgi:hypothetical protein
MMMGFRVMAHLFASVDDPGGWSLWPLEAGAYQFCGGGLEPLDNRSFDGATTPLLLVRRGGGADEEWVLLSDRQSMACVNGQPLVLGARVLRDRDEIHVRGAASPEPLRCFFSLERLAQVAPLPAGDSPVRCVRCKDVIAPGQPAVRCPACQLWHHQIAGGKNCWTYRPGCASCGQPTQLDGTYRWTPEAL